MKKETPNKKSSTTDSANRIGCSPNDRDIADQQVTVPGKKGTVKKISHSTLIK